MREIKFEYGFQSVNGIVKKVYFLHELPKIEQKCDMWNMLPLVYVRQFTGLVDKNGVDIYEGDVVNFRANYTNKQCGWLKGIIIYDDNNYYKPSIKVGDVIYDMGEETDEFPYTCEIIGNIYQNPELINN